jgi:hypothetical protein
LVPIYLLDARPVVPGPVEEHHFARGGQVGDVALEVPLRLLGFGGLLECHHARAAGVEVLREPLDGAALARGVTAFEHDDVPGAGVLAPALQLQEFDLQSPLDVLVVVARHPLVVGVTLAPRLDGIAVAVE